MIMSIWGIVLGLILLGLMMFVHEGGHFLAGKILRFKILSFNICMGPVLWQHRGRDGVDYCLRLIPIGASVRFAGEEEAEGEMKPDNGQEATDPGFFMNRPRWARALVILMGPCINFLTAILAFSMLFTLFPFQLPYLAAVKEGSAAARAGLKVGDELLAIDGEKIRTDLDYRLFLAQNGEGNHDFLLRRRQADGRMENIQLSFAFDRQEKYLLGITYDPETSSVLAVSEYSNGGNPVLKKGDQILSVNEVSFKDQGAIAALLAREAEQDLTVRVVRQGENLELPMRSSKMISSDSGLELLQTQGGWSAIRTAWRYPASIVRQSIKGLGQLVRGRLSAKEALTGPVGIVAAVGTVVGESQSWRLVLLNLLNYFAFISVALGFTNLLPLPVLDGGHLLILAIEGGLRRDLSPAFKARFMTVGVVLLLALALLVLYVDLLRLWT